MILVSISKLLTVVLAGLVIVIALSGGLVMADDVTSTVAGVQVLPGENITFGARVIGINSVLLPGRALGEPDGRGAIILLNGWISLELKKNVLLTNTIIIWVANIGWQSSNMKVYVSTDGKKWKLVDDKKVTSANFKRYDFISNFGNVKYIKVSRSGGPWSWLLLDAVGAKGGDTHK
jgi:hypothetical protein